MTSIRDYWVPPEVVRNQHLRAMMDACEFQAGPNVFNQKEKQMNKPHKHAAIIKAWADGAEVQFLYEGAADWAVTTMPSWSKNVQYRIKPVPHKWQKEIDAYARGEAVEWKFCHGGRWVGLPSGLGEPAWSSSVAEYRIKPKDIVEECFVASLVGPGFSPNAKNNLRMIFDGSTGELKSAEVIR